MHRGIPTCGRNASKLCRGHTLNHDKTLTSCPATIGWRLMRRAVIGWRLLSSALVGRNLLTRTAIDQSQGNSAPPTATTTTDVVYELFHTQNLHTNEPHWSPCYHCDFRGGNDLSARAPSPLFYLSNTASQPIKRNVIQMCDVINTHVIPHVTRQISETAPCDVNFVTKHTSV